MRTVKEKEKLCIREHGRGVQYCARRTKGRIVRYATGGEQRAGAGMERGLAVRDRGGRDRGGRDRGFPLVLYLESTSPFRGYFYSPALPGNARAVFRSYAEIAGEAGDLTDQVRTLFRAGKYPETETWRLPPAGRRADRVLFIQPGRDGTWSGDIYTPGAMRLETFRNPAELERLLCFRA